VRKSQIRIRNWPEYYITEGNAQVAIGKENYFLSGDGLLMPAKKDQPPARSEIFQASAEMTLRHGCWRPSGFTPGLMPADFTTLLHFSVSAADEPAALGSGGGRPNASRGHRRGERLRSRDILQ